MLTLKKDGALKIIDPESSLLPLLKKQGWMIDGEEESPRRGRPPKEKETE